MTGTLSLFPQQPNQPSLRARNHAAAVASGKRIFGQPNPPTTEAIAPTGTTASPIQASLSGNAQQPARRGFKSPLSGIANGYKSPLSGAASGYQSPLSGAASGYSSPLSGAANRPVPSSPESPFGILPAVTGALSSIPGAARGVKHPYSGIASGYQSPLSGAASGYQSPLSGAASGYQSPVSGAAAGYQAPVSGAASGYRSPLSGIANVPNSIFQPDSLHHRQMQTAARTKLFDIPATPIQATLGNVGSPAAAMAPAVDQPAPVSTAEFGQSFPSAGQLTERIGSEIRPVRTPTPPPAMFGPEDHVGQSPLTNALLSSHSQPARAAAQAPMQSAEDPDAAVRALFDAMARQGVQQARAMGEQRHYDSPQGQRRAADIARVTSTYKPDFGPGAAMAGRESVLAAAAQPAGPSWADRHASSQAGMLGLVGQALAGQGDLPPENLHEGIRQLPPGTTLRGTSDMGTPMVVSRGNAQAASPELQQSQSNYLADRRGARLGRLREAVQGNAQRLQAGQMQQQQAMMAQAQQQQLQQMFARDPQATTQLMAAMGQQQIGIGRNQLLGQQIAGEQQIEQQRLLADATNNQVNVGLRRRELQQRHELARQQLQQQEGLTKAQAEQALAEAEQNRAKTGVIQEAGTPEGQIRSALLGGLGEALPEVMAGDFDLQDRLRGAVGDAIRGMVPLDRQLTTSPGATQESAQRQPLGPSNAGARLAQTSPMMQAIFGEDTSTWTPAELLSPILERAGGQGALSDAELARVQQHLRYMGAQNPDLAKPAPGLVNRIFGGEQDVLSAGALFEAMMGQQPVTSSQVTEILGSGRQRMLTERQQREQSRRVGEQTMKNMMFAHPRMGPG